MPKEKFATRKGIVLEVRHALGRLGALAGQFFRRQDFGAQSQFSSQTDTSSDYGPRRCLVWPHYLLVSEFRRGARKHVREELGFLVEIGHENGAKEEVEEEPSRRAPKRNHRRAM